MNTGSLLMDQNNNMLELRFSSRDVWSRFAPNGFLFSSIAARPPLCVPTYIIANLISARGHN